MAQDRPPPPPASIRFCDARRQADRPRIGPRSMLCGPARTTDASVSSPLAATMPTTRASSQSMLLSFHDLRIMVTHGFRNQQNAPAKNYNCNARWCLRSYRAIKPIGDFLHGLDRDGLPLPLSCEDVRLAFFPISNHPPSGYNRKQGTHKCNERY